MYKIKKNYIDIILSLLDRFLSGETGIISKKYHRSPKILHYYNEIVRYWSKLNFIIRKTLRSLNIQSEYDQLGKALYLYMTYRILWENASNNSLYNELNISNEDLKIYQFLKKLRTFKWEQAIKGKSKIENLSIKEAIPTFFINHLRSVMSFKDIGKNIEYMNNIKNCSEFSVRINTLNSTIEEIQNNLKRENVNFHIDQEIPEIIHIPIEKREIISKSLRKGNVAIQDKGSVAVVNVLSPHPNEFICDMCAAPGMKTSLIAQYTRNESKILAGEFLLNRMSEMKKILYKLGVKRTFLLNTDSIKFPIRFENYFDKVLLDAPCTGSGTFLSNPELKWRQNENFLNQNVVLQEKLLKNALNLLKPQGTLVYSTCSLYPEEGEYQINKYLEKLEPMTLPDWMGKSYQINGSYIPGTVRLFPAQHHKEGFFIAKFKKKK
jgi:16S rRNA (cytosine967-C5)-methyltransferase